MQGTVKWFNSKKGFGFIIDSETKKEYFVHFSGIKMDGYKTLRDNEKVNFELQESPKGMMCIDVEKIKEEV
jgi:cold shock protein